MVDYIGRKVIVKTEGGNLEGTLISYDQDQGKLAIEDSMYIKKELGFLDILELNSADSINRPQNGFPLTEIEMHRLFYEAFNIYGPLEDNFCWLVASGLKKFLKDVSSSKIKIIIGSDDIFGRIGLCLGRMLYEKAERVDVVLVCDVFDLRTLRYKDIFLNAGGRFEDSRNDFKYTMTVFAANRHFEYKSQVNPTGQIILIDLPTVSPFDNFIGIGLGFVPENHMICSGYYIMDCGFCKTLIEKYGICSQFKSFMVKVVDDQKQNK